MSQSIVLTALVGRMKVEAFARLVGLDTKQLVALLLEHGAPAPAPPPGARALVVASADPPELASMIDRDTYQEIHTAVDRWYVVNVMNEERANVSRVARRLRVSRKRVRTLWTSCAAVDEDVAHESRAHGEPSNAPPPPALEPLLAEGTYRQIHDAVDRWLLIHTVARVGGNVSRAARELAISRKCLRDRLARVR